SRRGLPAGDRRVERAAVELDGFGTLAHADHRALLRPHGLAGCVPRTSPDGAGPGAAAEIRSQLEAGPAWGRHAPALAAFHHLQGCGPLAVARVLRFSG